MVATAVGTVPIWLSVTSITVVVGYIVLMVLTNFWTVAPWSLLKHDKNKKEGGSL